MSEEIKVSASDRSLIKIIDDANYSGYGNAVTAEIERLQTKIAALQKEVAELKEQVKWRKEHMEESDKELVQIQDWLRAGGDIFISSSEMMARVKERIRDLIAIEGEAGDFRTQNRELKFTISEISTHLEPLGKALIYCEQNLTVDDDDRSYWRHEIEAHEKNSELIRLALQPEK